MINGTDEISLKAIESFKEGRTIQRVCDEFNITYDQGKKLSQYANMQLKLVSIPQELQDKFKKLGLKVLVLNSLFKDNDIEGIKEIIESVEINIKREQLKLLPEAIKIKRDRLKKAKIDADRKIRELEELQNVTEEKIKELEENKKKLDESIFFLKDMENEKAKEFLMDHLGVAKGKIVLYKRLDISWQQSLKLKKFIHYNESTYTWEILDLDELKRQTERRVKNNYNMYYDPDKASGMYADWYPINPVYKNATGLTHSLLESIKENEKQIRALRKKKKEVNKDLKLLKGTKIQSYIEASEVVDYLSEYDILQHRKLQNAGMRYLYGKDYVVITEVAKDAYRFDVVGYNRCKELIIIEAKASIEDFKQDTKFHRYLDYCNKMYFIFDYKIFNRHRDEIYNRIQQYNNIGVLVVHDEDASVETEGENKKISESIKDDLIFSINRIFSRKYVYGI